MYDTFEPLLTLKKEPFRFQPERYQIWVAGKIVKSGNTSIPIIATVFVVEGKEKMKVMFYDWESKISLNNELLEINIFDEFVTTATRLMLITVPIETKPDSVGIVNLRLTFGSTSLPKNFLSNEPYCCSIFTINNSIEKITFSFSNPEKLIEFYD